MTARSYEFDGFRLDAARRELWRGGERVVLQPRAFDTLVWLIENRTRAVGRDELIAAVWGKVDVTDNVLAQMIKRARHAVGDSGDEQRCIRVVPRFGYHWVAPTRVVEAMDAHEFAAMASPDRVSVASAASPPDEHEVAAAQPAPAVTRSGWLLRRRPVAIMAAALLALAVALVVWRLPPRATKPAATSGMSMVLPVNVDADREFSWVRLGVMDFLADKLRVAGQQVVPSDTVVALASSWRGARPGAEELERIAREGNAGLMLAVDAAFSGGHWRVQLRTVHGRTPAIQTLGESADVLDAARFAYENLAAELGLSPPRGERKYDDPRLARAVQQVKAAVLANRLNEARALLDGLDADLLSVPAVALMRAQIDFSAGRINAAGDALERLRDRDSFADSPERRAEVLLVLGQVYWLKSDYDRAWRSLSEAIAAVEPLSTYDATNTLGRALVARGVTASVLRGTAAARADYARARVALESTGDQVALARLDNHVGALLMTDADRPEEALRYLERAAERSAAFADVATELRARTNIALAQLALRDTIAALANDERMRELLSKVAEPQFRHFVAYVHAWTLAEGGRLTEADALLRAELANVSVESDPAEECLGHAVAARLALARKEFARAEQESALALQPALREADLREYSRTWLTLIRAMLALGKRDAAGEQVSALRTWAQPLPQAAANVYARLADAELSLTEGDRATAARAFDAALTAAAAGRIPADTLEVAKAYAPWLIRNGDLATAAGVIDRLSPWASRDFDAALLRLRLYHALNQHTAWQAALTQAQALAGERAIPDDLQSLAAAPP